MNYLLLTLGHGSSAIFVDNTEDKQKVIGYEQERLSGIKADSQFPIDAINEIEHNVGFKAMKHCTIVISHWFNDYQKHESSSTLYECKYMTKKDIEKLESYKPGNIFVTNNAFTHHDAHAYSAYSFYDYNKKQDKYKPLYCIVADGFGTNEEVLSIYRRQHNSEPELIHRAYGYDTSLGLFYQYATAYVGMKENQDEYKFLGYEAHIDEVFDAKAIAHIIACISRTVNYFMRNIEANTEKTLPATDDIIDHTSLCNCREYWYKKFDEVLKPLNTFSKDSYAARCAIAYYIQQTIECVMQNLASMFEMNNICVVGGCFYNVKLNNAILTHIKGDFCAMPLAGDQGAAIGLYAYLENKQFNFGDLCWGKRRMYNITKLLSNNKNVIVVDKTASLTDEFIDKVASDIASNKIINIVRGNMEFGPRALCNTSTLMLPSKRNVAINNRMNNRNEVMPCAPICTDLNAYRLFDSNELNRTIGSDKYMICTHSYKKVYSELYGGVMHKKTLSKKTYTGRPQIIHTNDEFMYKLLARVYDICDAKCLVNTSFNAHGNPIVFDTMDIIRNFKYQCEHIDEANCPILIVII